MVSQGTEQICPAKCGHSLKVFTGNYWIILGTLNNFSRPNLPGILGIFRHQHVIQFILTFLFMNISTTCSSEVLSFGFGYPEDVLGWLLLHDFRFGLVRPSMPTLTCTMLQLCSTFVGQGAHEITGDVSPLSIYRYHVCPGWCSTLRIFASTPAAPANWNFSIFDPCSSQWTN